MTGKPNRAERIIAFLEARYPGWVPAIELEPIGGRCAWRTAVSEGRAIVKARGDDIENRTRKMRGFHGDEIYLLSEYRLKKGSESTPDPGSSGDGKTTTILRASEPHALGEYGDLRAHNETAPRDGHNVNEWGLR